MNRLADAISTLRKCVVMYPNSGAVVDLQMITKQWELEEKANQARMEQVC